jgi:cyclopropane fatty-acyl-phospholipid synthase-like methyltransferase
VTVAETEAFWQQRYAQAPATLDVPASHRILDRALAFFGDVAGKTIIDLGCGEGITSLYLARHGARVLAVDFSRPAVEHLAAYCRTRGIQNVECVCEDAMRVDRLGPVDAIFGSMILHHLEPFDQFAASLRGALAPGGRAFFWENNAASGPLMWCRDHVAGRGWIPKFGDPAERPLSPREVDHLRAHLHVDVEYPEMHFFRLLAGYVFRGRLQRAFSSLDDFCFRHGLLVDWSYRQYLMIQRA